MFVVIFRRVKVPALSADGTGSCLSDEDSRKEKHRGLRLVPCIPLHRAPKRSYSGRTADIFFPAIWCAEGGIFLNSKHSRRGVSVALFGNLKIMVASAFLVAISIVCGKYLAIRGGDVLRFSFENLPILLAGIAFGPLVGFVVGIAADLVGCMMVGYTINPLVTLGAAMIGLTGGLVYRVARAMPPAVSLALSVGIAHIIGSVLTKTVGLAAFYDMPLHILMLWRLLNYLIVGVLEYVILLVVLRNKTVRAQLMRLTRSR